MPLKFGDIWRRFSPIGNWRLPGEPTFAKSRAFELLSRDLRRYVLEEVAGRSFLIAGHRGAGKTSTVVHAVRQLRRELIAGSVDPVSIPTGRRGRLQRPMLVKLVGEAILSAPPRQKEVEQATGEEETDSANRKKEGEGEGQAGPGGNGGQAGAGDGGEAGAGPDRVGNALVHITIALYRALAAEVAEAFTSHSLDGDERDRPDRLELAAQLALELDGTPEPAMLRSYWDRIGRLQSGILWPRESDQAIEQSAIRDQGLKEIIAITTAAQAFQVCSGAVTYKVGREQSDKTESKTESKVDAKELANRLGALGAGALAGSVVGVGSGAAQGVGIGLLVWLLSGITLSWTGSRERKASRTLNYQFIQDRSVQTLDRDLPVVIDRIRQAGLAPVFVIDELDKLIEDEPGEKIATIIHRLKHLVADYGFFCFLANRDYFDLIQRKVADEAYPTEHTYFSERVLVLSRAEDLYDYLLGLLEDVPEEGPGALRAAVFALVVMFRSKLNFSDVAREVATLTGSNDELICTDEELQSPGPYRLAATIQIAIDRILASEDIRERMELDSGFAQLAVDALYYIARAWESDTEACVDIRPRPLRDELLERMNADKAPRPDPLPPGDFPGLGEECAISPSDLRTVVGMVDRLASYLSNFRSLQNELQSEAERAADPAEAARLKRLADIVLTERTAMLAPAEAGTTGRHCFVLNELARPISPPPAPAPPPPPPPPPPPAPRTRRPRRPKALVPPPTEEKGQVPPPAPAEASEAVTPPVPAAGAETTPAPSAAPDQRLDELKPFFDALGKLLSLFEVSVDDLGASGLLPSTVSQSLFDGARNDLALATRDPSQIEATERAISAYLAFVRALDDRGTEVAQALVTLAEARNTSGTRDGMPRILGRLSRYFETSGAIVLPSPIRSPLEWVTLSGNPESIDRFIDYYGDLKLELEKAAPWTQLALRAPDIWQPWANEIEKFLIDGQTSAQANIRLDTIITAAADLPPGNLFRLRLGRMDAGDWSRVALTAVPYPDRIERTPAWPLFAGLAALGFNSALLQELRNAVLQAVAGKGLEPADHSLINGLIRLPAYGPTGLLLVLPDQPSRRFLPISESQPILAVGVSELEQHLPALNWLAERGVFDGGIRELD